MNKYIVTFGQVHAHRVNGYTFDKDSVAIIQAPDYVTGREIAFRLFEAKFHQFILQEDYDKEKLAEFFPRGAHPANFKE